MKHIFLIFFLLTLILLPTTAKAKISSYNQLVTHITVFDNDSIFRYSYLYDGEGRNVLETKFYKQDNSWSRLSQTEWTFDAGNCTTQTERKWNGSIWQNNYKIDYYYTDNKLTNENHSCFFNGVSYYIKKTDFEYNNNVVVTQKEYSNVNDRWVLMYQTDNSYSTSGNIDSISFSVNQSGNMVKTNIFKNMNATDGSILSQIQQVKDSIGVWRNSILVNWYYHPVTKKLISLRLKEWNNSISNWDNLQRTDYDYNDNNQIISETYQYWKYEFWLSDLRYTYFYDGNGTLTKKTLSKPIYHDWRNFVSINYSNFTSDKANLMESKYEFWGGNTGDLVTSFIPYNFNNEIAIQKAKSVQISYFVGDTLQSTPKINSTHSIEVYPNPSNGIFYISTQNHEIQSWFVADLEGRILKNQIQALYSGVIDIADLPKGVYLLKVVTKDNLLTQRLIRK